MWVSTMFLLSLLSVLSLLHLSAAAPAPGTLLASWPPAGANYSFNGASELSTSPVLGTCGSSNPLLYVPDRFSARVLAVDTNNGSVVRLYNNSGLLQQPLSAVSDGSSLYVVELSFPNRLTKLSLATGAQQAQVAFPGMSLYGVAVDPNGFLWLSVLSPYTVKLRSSDLAIVLNVSAAFYPVAVTVAAGNVYVNDVRNTLNATVAAFSINYPTPSTISQLYDRNHTVRSSFGLAVDPSGNIFVDDLGVYSVPAAYNRIVAFSPQGKELLSINLSAISTSFLPYGVALDCAGNIYVSDGTSRVLKFQGLAAAAPSVSGDPMFTGLLGQRYQVHGVDGSVYALISDRQVQVNARFGFLDGGDCLRDEAGQPLFTCWTHPGSYLTALSVHVEGGVVTMQAGGAKDGFESVVVVGGTSGRMKVGDKVTVGGAEGMEVEYLGLRTVRLVRAGGYELTVENSDGFLNLKEVRVNDWEKLVGDVQSHGLLGQTWRRGVEGGEVKGLEGRVDDYVLQDGLLSCSFLYSKHEC